MGVFFCFSWPAFGHGVWTNPSPWSILKDVIFLDNKVQRFAVEILENVAIHAVLADFKIVENHAFSQEGEGAQNCLCRKVGPFVEAWVRINFRYFRGGLPKFGLI